MMTILACCTQCGTLSVISVMFKRFRRTRDIRAILWATHLACASMAAQAALIGALATLWRVRRSLVCVTAPTDGRFESPASLRKSRSRATSHRRRRWATSLVERARPHDSGSGPCMPRKSSAGRARPPLLKHPSISSTLTVGDDIIADGAAC